jgi:hypothetical protein
MLIITPPGFTPVFVGVRVAHLFSFLCCVLFLSSACVLYTQCCQLAQCLWIVHRFLAHLAFRPGELLSSLFVRRLSSVRQHFTF